jgi:hypothetical protein
MDYWLLVIGQWNEDFDSHCESRQRKPRERRSSDRPEWSLQARPIPSPQWSVAPSTVSSPLQDRFYYYLHRTSPTTRHIPASLSDLRVLRFNFLNILSAHLLHSLRSLRSLRLIPSPVHGCFTDHPSHPCIHFRPSRRGGSTSSPFPRDLRASAVHPFTGPVPFHRSPITDYPALPYSSLRPSATSAPPRFIPSPVLCLSTDH